MVSRFTLDTYDMDENGACTLVERLVSLKDLNTIQEEQREWSTRVFGPQDATLPLLGVVEEVGELCHAVLKRKQDIRHDEDHYADERDAIGDIVIFLLDYCNRRGFNLLELINDAWEIVRERDKSAGGGLLARQRDDGTWVYTSPTAQQHAAGAAAAPDGPNPHGHDAGHCEMGASDGPGFRRHV